MEYDNNVWEEGFRAGLHAAQAMTGFTDETMKSILAKEGLEMEE